MLAAINASASGDNEIVPAKTGMTIRVLAYFLVAAAEVVTTWKSGASTELSGPMTLIKGVPLAPTPAMPGTLRPALVETTAGEALNLGLGGAVQVSGHLEYEYRLV